LKIEKRPLLSIEALSPVNEVSEQLIARTHLVDLWGHQWLYDMMSMLKQWK
jgi:hypothetical protein